MRAMYRSHAFGRGLPVPSRIPQPGASFMLSNSRTISECPTFRRLVPVASRNVLTSGAWRLSLSATRRERFGRRLWAAGCSASHVRRLPVPSA